MGKKIGCPASGSGTLRSITTTQPESRPENAIVSSRTDCNVVCSLEGETMTCKDLFHMAVENGRSCGAATLHVHGHCPGCKKCSFSSCSHSGVTTTSTLVYSTSMFFACDVGYPQ